MAEDTNMPLRRSITSRSSRRTLGLLSPFIAEHHKFKLRENQFVDIADEESRAIRDGFKLSSIDSNMATGLFKYENVTDMA